PSTGSGTGGGFPSTGSGTGGGEPPPPPACARPGVDPHGDPLDRLRWVVAAHWAGMAGSPWGPPFPGDINVPAGGADSADCLESSCIALYYGSDQDDPGKMYAIDAVDSVGRGFGNIDIFFQPNDYNTDVLGDIEVSEDLTSLTFLYTHYEGGSVYGPIEYRLACHN